MIQNRRPSRSAGTRFLRPRQDPVRSAANRSIKPRSRRRGLLVTVVYLLSQLYVVQVVMGLLVVSVGLLVWQAVSLGQGNGWLDVTGLLTDPGKVIVAQPLFIRLLTSQTSTSVVRWLVGPATLGLVLLCNGIFSRRLRGIRPARLGFRWPPPVARMAVAGFVALLMDPLATLPWTLRAHPAFTSDFVVANFAISFGHWLPHYLLLAGGEELIYRGFVLQVLETSWGRPAALLGSALFFAVSHFAYGQFDIVSGIEHVAFGLLLGYLFLVTRSLWITTACHAGWNIGVQLVTNLLGVATPSPASPVIFGMAGDERAWMATAIVAVACVGLLVAVHRRNIVRGCLATLSTPRPRFHRIGLAEQRPERADQTQM